MSMPNIPNIKPEIKISRTEVIDLLLSSIGLEEISLAHLANAEAEKLQYILGLNLNLHDLLKANKSIDILLRDTIKKEMLLQFKFENILELLEKGYEEKYEGFEE